MCTVVIQRRPGHEWPLILGANRDEMADRPWLPPARHWPDRPAVVAGKDALAGGTWLGLNDRGVVVAMLNRFGSLGPKAGYLSRGALALDALGHADAAAAARALTAIDGRNFRSFNAIVADAERAFWLRSRNGERDADPGEGVQAIELPAGLSMITAFDRNDPRSARVRTYLRRFEAAPLPDPRAGDWQPWANLMASRTHDADAGPGSAMAVVTESGFGTVCSSLLALPARDRGAESPVWLFAAGRPGEAPYRPVALEGAAPLF